LNSFDSSLSLLTKTTTIIECENRTHPTRITLLLEMLDLQGLPVPPTLNLPKRLRGALRRLTCASNFICTLRQGSGTLLDPSPRHVESTTDLNESW